MDRNAFAQQLDATTRTMIASMAALIAADAGTDYDTYYAELAAVAEAWEMDTLLSARATLDLMADCPTVFTATWIFQGEIGHRLHGRPRPSREQLRWSGFAGV